MKTERRIRVSTAAIASSAVRKAVQMGAVQTCSGASDALWTKVERRFRIGRSRMSECILHRLSDGQYRAITLDETFDHLIMARDGLDWFEDRAV